MFVFILCVWEGACAWFLPCLCLYFSTIILAKHFIVDDICTYIGSQNLYICDLAEWGVVIDHPEQVQSIKAQYWDPMWKTSYLQDDCEVDKVMDGLKINRDEMNKYEMTKLQLEQAKAKIRASENIPHFSQFHRQKKDDEEDEPSQGSSETDSEGEE